MSRSYYGSSMTAYYVHHVGDSYLVNTTQDGQHAGPFWSAEAAQDWITKKLTPDDFRPHYDRVERDQLNIPY